MDTNRKSGPKTIKIADIPKLKIKCRYCHHEIEFSYLPVHEYACKNSEPADFKGSSSSHAHESVTYVD